MLPSELTKAERAALVGKSKPIVCPHCGQELTRSQVATLMRSISTPKRRNASRENGKLGGRPKKDKAPV